MLAVDTGNQVLREALEEILASSVPTSFVNLTVPEFDSIRVKIAGYQDNDTLICLIGGPNVTAILDAGGLFVIERYFAGFGVERSVSEYNLGIVINRAEVRDQAQKTAALFSRIRSHLVAAIFQVPLENLLKGVQQQPLEILYRENERVWVLPTEDRVTFILEVRYDNVQDRSMAKIFLVEFEESKRNVTNAPLITFSPKAPVSLNAFSVADSPNSHYLSLTFLKAAFKADSQKKVESISVWLGEFKRYMTYHIHGLKGYLHSRMRKKTAGFLKVLEAAVPETLESKTFKRVRGTQTFREETQIVNDIVGVNLRDTISLRR